MQWADYMQPLSYQVKHTFTLQQVARYLAVHQLTSVVVMKESTVIGVIDQETIVHHIDHLQTVAQQVVTPVASKLLSELSVFTKLPVLIHNQQGQSLGLLTVQALPLLMQQFFEHYTLETHAFQTTLAHAYEGIVVVDRDGIIIEFNEAYSRFTGVPRARAIGRHVTDIIDNTNMHTVIRTGVAERNQQQMINGQQMTVHRIPLIDHGTIVGGIGFLMFEEITKIYRVYDQMHQNNLMQTLDMKDALHTHERDLIVQTLKECGGNKVKAAKALGIHRTTLYQKLKKLNIE
jgi:PAS domain S-box-containing protein